MFCNETTPTEITRFLTGNDREGGSRMANQDVPISHSLSLTVGFPCNSNARRGSMSGGDEPFYTDGHTF